MTYPITSGTSMMVAPLTNGQDYSFYVTTIGSGGGESQPSTPVSARPRATPPNAPTSVAATSHNDGSITVSWHRANANDWYWVYYHDDTADPSGSVAFTHGPYPVTTGSSLRMEGLKAGHRYSFFVTTISSANGTESGPSDVVRAWSYLAPPTNLRLSANVDGSVTLQWNASLGNVSYYWVYMKVGSGSFNRLPYPVHNQTSFVATGLRTGQTHQFYVTAAGSYGNESGASNAPSIVPRLTAPSGLSATVSGWGTVTLRWSKPFSGALYWVYLHDNTADPEFRNPYTRLPLPLNENSANGFPVGDGLTGDHTYSFYVTTAYAGNESGPSNVVAPNRKIAAPTGLRGRTVANSNAGGGCEADNGPRCHIRLSWNAVDGAHHYDVYRRLVSAEEVSSQYIGTSYGTTHDMPVGGLLQLRVEYEVVAVRWYGTSRSWPSTPVTITVGDHGGEGTDCYVLAKVPTVSGNSVKSVGQAVCPRSSPHFEVIIAGTAVDGEYLYNADSTTCPGTNYSCTSVTSTPLRRGTHTYCTFTRMNIVTWLSGNSVGGLTASIDSRCVRLTG